MKTQSDQLQNILPWSEFLQQQLQKHPDWVDRLLNSTPYCDGELHLAIKTKLSLSMTEIELMEHVRLIRHFEMCRIAYRDLSGISTLTETFQDTSDLAGSLMDGVLLWCYQKLSKTHGKPRNEAGEIQKLVVLGMGKLGGRELNFSSDIDLIFAFPENGNTDGKRSLDNRSYFVRLGQMMNNILNKTTSEGIAYRVDMRLRPFGKSGALALSFDAMEHYYQIHGREWERYAMIKARPVAGDIEKGYELLERLRGFFYRQYLDYGSIENLREMKQLIDQEAQRKGKYNDLKLGEGGIREIEFIAQVFQLVRGGQLTELQQTNLLSALTQIKQLELMPVDDVDTLIEAYVFLRRAENRLQMWQDRQVHCYQNAPEAQQRLAASMGFNDWSYFKIKLDQHAQSVAEFFQDIFAKKQSDQAEEYPIIIDDLNTSKECIRSLKSLGYKNSEQRYQTLRNLKNSTLYFSLTEKAQARLNELLPQIIQQCTVVSDPDIALERSVQILEKIASRSGYLSMLATHSGALKQFVILIHASQWMTHRLMRHPLLLDQLLDTRQLYHAETKASLRIVLDQEIARSPYDDEEQILERFRAFKQNQVLRVAAIDLMDALPLMKVSDQLTWIAEVILEKVLEYAKHHLVDKYGEPQYEYEGKIQKAEFAIVGYGKLGGIELSYGSDLDVVFLHDSKGKNQYTRPTTQKQKSIDNRVFFMRLVQKIIHICSVLTYNGRLYEIDTRLRPDGASGMPASQIQAFQDYQHNKAWVWERQALVRARVITGSDQLIAEFNKTRQKSLSETPQKHPDYKQEIRKMREKMWRNQDKSKAGFLHLKKSHGGIIDIEFIVQYLAIKHAAEISELLQYTDNINLLATFKRHQILPPECCDFLTDSYKNLRNHIHRLTLQEKDAVISIDAVADTQNAIKSCWSQIFSVDGDLSSER